MASPGRNPNPQWLTPQWTVAPAVRAVTAHTDWLAMIATGIMLATWVFCLSPDGFVWENDASVSGDSSGGNLARRLQWAPLFVIATYIVWRRRIIAMALVPDMNPFLLAFIAFATTSMLWSPVPGAMLPKLTIFYGTLLIGLSLQLAGWRPNRFAELVRLSLTIMMVASLVLALAVPDIGRMPTGEFAGHWRGTTSHKNLLSAMAAAGGFFWVHAWAARRVKAWRCACGVLLALVLLVMAGGKTGLGTLLVTAPAVWLLNRPPVGMPNLLSVVTISLVLVLAFFCFTVLVAFGGIPGWTEFVGPIAELFGKDPTLTARAQLWQLMWTYIDDHWWLGHGFESFWLGPVGPSGEIIEKLYWTPWQGHSGYMDVLNETGIIGLTLTVCFILCHFYRIWRLSLFDAENASLHLGIVVMVLLANITESSFYSGTSAYWLLLLFSSLSVSRALSGRVARLGGVRTGPRIWVAEDHAVTGQSGHR